MIIKRPASLVRQGNLMLYATALRVRDLRGGEFCRIDTLDVDKGVGFQRVLNEARAKRLCDYLVEAHKVREAFLPTSIFLATHKLLPFDEASNTITIDTEKTGPFNVVDGQHRIRGLLLAAEKDPEMDGFEIPVNIAVGLDEISQMCHFLIVNTTQKSVDEAIEQQIVARLTEMINFEKTPVLPKWIQKQVDKRDDHKAVAIAKFLNTDEASPWKGRIIMANSEGGESGFSKVNQKSFVNSLKKYILVPSNPINSGETASTDKQQKVLTNYWAAIRSLLVDQGDELSVVFRTNGMHVFHAASPTVFLHLANQRDFKQGTITALLKHGFDNLSNEYLPMGSPSFWHRGGPASGLNQAALRKYSQALSAAINAPKDTGDIAL